jgi:chromosomal replication initiator protein
MPGVCKERIVIIAVCEHFSISEEWLKKRGRKRPMVERKYICMYLLRKYTKLQLSIIGEMFGLDHTTVIHACQSVPDWMETDPNIKESVMAIELNL